MTTLRLKDIERFRIRDARTGQTWMGHDQEWYGTPWQRLAGCGPTTACNLFRYLAPALPASATCAMQPGREDLFHSSYSELTSVMNAVINAWCAKALLKYLPSDSLCFNQCTMLLFTALSDGRRHLFIQPVSSGLPYGISITFPHDFVTFYEGVK